MPSTTTSCFTWIRAPRSPTTTRAASAIMLLVPERELAEHPLMHGLGVEPLGPELTPAYLAQRAQGQGRRSQGVSLRPAHRGGARQHLRVRGAVSGRARAEAPGSEPGDEDRAPHRARRRLAAAIRAVLKDAIAAGGSSLRDYRRADGALGEFQHAFAVYGREGEPCVRPGLPRQGEAHRAGGPLDLLLPRVPALRRLRPCRGAGRARGRSGSQPPTEARA